MQKTYNSFSFGCRVNTAETEELNRKLNLAGFTRSDTNPEIYIVNTCAVTNKAEREARQFIYQLHKKYPSTKIIATGCSVTYWKNKNVYANLPVFAFYDNTQKDYLVQLIGKWLSGGNESKIISGNKDKFMYSGRVIIKIQDGCQRFCSYCIVPYLRGMPRSVPIKEIIGKINNPDGMSEAILAAINTEAYGYDTKETFNSLIIKSVEETSIPRISFGSIHPWSLTDEFINIYKNIMIKHKLVDFFHVPLQSGSNKILSLMKRNYKKEDILEKLVILRKLNPYLFIGTDIIAGFLDESEKDFDDTYEFIKTSPINKLHVFRFSNRQNTAAWHLSKRLKEPAGPEKHQRSKALIELSQVKYAKFLGEHIGRDFSILFLKNRENGFQEGLLNNQVSAYIKTAKDLNGRIKTVQITGYKNGKLFGKIR